MNIVESMFGARKASAEEQLPDVGLHLAKEAREAYKEPLFIWRHQKIVEAVTQESNITARYFGNSFFERKGPWQDEQFWRDIKGALKTAAEQASSTFSSAFTKEGTPDKSEKGQAEYEAAHGMPGASVANRLFLMETMARLKGKYQYSLGINSGRRTEIAQEVDTALEDVSLLSLTDLVIEELAKAKKKRVPRAGALRKLSEEEIYERLTHNTYGDSDRETLIMGKQLKIQSKGRAKNEPKDALFLKLALTGAHATWEAMRPHRAVYEENEAMVDPASDEAFKPLPLYIRDKYEQALEDGGTPEEAVLAIAYTLYKDVRILRQEHIPAEARVTIPPVSFFAKGPVPKEMKPVKPSKKFPIGRAAAVLLASTSAASFPTELEDGAYHQGVSQDEKMLTSALAAAPREGATAAERARTPDNAIHLMRSFLQTLEQYPDQKAAFFAVYPQAEGATVDEQAHAMSRYFGLWNPNTGYSEEIRPGDYLGFNPDTGFWLANIGGEKQKLADQAGNRIAGPVH